MLSESIYFLKSIDYYEIIYAAIGAFLGFGLTLIIEKKNQKNKENSLITSSLKSITLELNDILFSINSCGRNQRIIIDIPIYEAFVQSGNVFILVDKFYFINLIRTYSKIKVLCNMENSDKISDSVLASFRTETSTEIIALLNLLNKQ